MESECVAEERWRYNVKLGGLNGVTEGGQRV